MFCCFISHRIKLMVTKRWLDEVKKVVNMMIALRVSRSLSLSLAIFIEHHFNARSLMIIRQIFPTYDFCMYTDSSPLSLLSSTSSSYTMCALHSHQVSNNSNSHNHCHSSGRHTLFPNMRLFVFTIRSFIWEVDKERNRERER